jgi:ATP-dependent Clp protease ATP-binding subunit ClpC
VVLAQDESRTLGHDYIGTEHLLLGLVREEEGLGAQVLDALGVTIDEVRALVAQIVGRGSEVATGQIPFTPRAKKALELSLGEALSLGHNYVGTEHLLLGLVRENGGVAARILLEFNVTADVVRDTMTDLLSGETPAEQWRQRRQQQDVQAAAPAESIRFVSTRSSASLLVAGAAICLVALAVGLLLGYLLWH